MRSDIKPVMNGLTLFIKQPIIQLKLTAMHEQLAQGYIKVFNTWQPLQLVMKLNANVKHREDRFFLPQPIPVPGKNYSRKSFFRHEIEGYKAS